jgi:hypothetical protein
VHWPDLDEDLSAAGMLSGVPAPKTSRVLKTLEVSAKRASAPA